MSQLKSDLDRLRSIPSEDVAQRVADEEHFDEHADARARRASARKLDTAVNDFLEQLLKYGFWFIVIIIIVLFLYTLGLICIYTYDIYHGQSSNVQGILDSIFKVSYGAIPSALLAIIFERSRKK